MRRSLMCIAVFSAFLPAVAQMRVCMGGNLDTLTVTDRRACEEQVARARVAADNAHSPDNWHFVVVCGEDGWKDYMAFSAAGETALINASVDTDAANKTTFLRGTRMTTMDAANQIMTEVFRPNPPSIQIARK